MKIIDCQTQQYEPDPSNCYELWIGTRWAVPTNIYFIICQCISNIDFTQCTVEADNDSIQLNNIISVCTCIQQLLISRMPFSVLFYKNNQNTRKELCGKLTWKGSNGKVMKNCE